MANIRKIKLDPNSMTLLSGLSTYVYKRPHAREALRDLEGFRARNLITEDVLLVGTSIVTGEIPAGASPEVRETAEYYLDVAKSYYPSATSSLPEPPAT